MTDMDRHTRYRLNNKARILHAMLTTEGAAALDELVEKTGESKAKLASRALIELLNKIDSDNIADAPKE